MEFELMNLSIFHPRKDRCVLCVAYDAGNVADDIWITHRQNKETARLEKSKDKALAWNGSEGDKMLVITMDLQAVLLSPKLQASALYYKTKLAVHNFTFFNLVTNDVKCYVWHEGEGSLTANEFSSCIFDYLVENALGFDIIVIYSDGCGYQNRNVTLSNTLQYFANIYKKMVVQKFLERGHTQMEVDSGHSVIERKLKHTNIYCPANDIELIRTARKNPRPYEVKYVDHTFFQDFSEVGTMKSIRPGNRIGDPTVSNLRCLKYTSEEPIQYKIKYTDSYAELPVPRRTSIIPGGKLKALYSSKLKIKSSKYKHLQELKEVLPKDYHNFYDSLEQ
ncbi:hypothetical protein LOTGIDRAFT_165402 [Lottia gigantea]|uniref:Uncharacterized protein n=1 Tax=Lottia gigantea TaxID=225164 RepID=V3ZC43_LOTGI|nr:hypothetical protein LOTGIDRAFT_165402 [Lottia gigantea]ESO88618.1 hypothetical protein LOTGIDRAFT_165402 [Lottia gigantea]